MHNEINNYLKQTERIHTLINRTYNLPDRVSLTPNLEWFQNRKDVMNSTGFQNIHKQLGFINQNTELISNYFAVKDTFNNFPANSVMEVLNKQKQFINQMNIIKGGNLDNIHRWHSSITRLVKIQNIDFSKPIPESFYTPLEELASEFENSSFFHNDSSDVLTEITVNKPESLSKEINLKQTIGFLFYAFEFFVSIYTVHDGYINDQQFQEEMIEFRRQSDQNERIIEINEEQLEIDKQRLEIEKEQIEHQKRLEDKFDALTESIEPFITNQSNHQNIDQ